MDWSCNNKIALAISSCAFIWDATDESINQLGDVATQDEYVSSVSWSEQGNFLAVGKSYGAVQVNNNIYNNIPRKSDILDMIKNKNLLPCIEIDSLSIVQFFSSDVYTYRVNSLYYTTSCNIKPFAMVNIIL